MRNSCRSLPNPEALRLLLVVSCVEDECTRAQGICDLIYIGWYLDVETCKGSPVTEHRLKTSSLRKREKIILRPTSLLMPFRPYYPAADMTHLPSLSPRLFPHLRLGCQLQDYLTLRVAHFQMREAFFPRVPWKDPGRRLIGLPGAYVSVHLSPSHHNQSSLCPVTLLCQSHFLVTEAEQTPVCLLYWAKCSSLSSRPLRASW